MVAENGELRRKVKDVKGKAVEAVSSAEQI